MQHLLARDKRAAEAEEARRLLALSFHLENVLTRTPQARHHQPPPQMVHGQRSKPKVVVEGDDPPHRQSYTLSVLNPSHQASDLRPPYYPAFKPLLPVKMKPSKPQVRAMQSVLAWRAAANHLENYDAQTPF